MAPIDVGLVGFGQGAAGIHAPLISQTPGLRLAGIAVNSEAGLERARSAYPAVPAYLTVDELLRLDGLGLVTIASPNQTHAALAEQVLAAGIDVVVDKPLTTALSDARHLEERAAQLGQRLLTFVNRRWDGDYAALRWAVRNGEVGKPLRLESRWERFRPAVPSRSWKDDPSAGGGLLWNLLPHLVDQAHDLLGPVEWVWARLEARRAMARADDETWVTLGHASGATTWLLGSYLSTLAGPRLRLVGSEATFLAGELDPTPIASHPTAHLCEPDETGASLRRAARIVGPAGSRTVTVPDDDHGAFYRELARAMGEGGSGPVSPSDGVAVVQILEAAQVSSSSGRVITLDRQDADQAGAR